MSRTWAELTATEIEAIEELGIGIFVGKQIATPSNPPSGTTLLYFKSNNKLYSLTSAGVETEIGSGGGTWGSITGTLSNQTDLQNALNAKQNSIGFTPEDVSNKDTTTTLGTSDTKYPSQKAVKTYVDGIFTENLADNHTSGATGDLWYRDSNGKVVRLGIGSTNDVLKVTAGLPSWGAASGGAATKYEGSIDGQVYLGTIYKFIIKETQTIAGVKASLGSLPTGANFILDIRKNGTATTDSIFTSDAGITVATNTSATNGQYTVTSTSIDNGSFVANDVMYVVVKQIGSTLPGSDLYFVAY